MKLPGRKPNLLGIASARRRAAQKSQSVEPRDESVNTVRSAMPQSFDGPIANDRDQLQTVEGIGPSDIWRHADRLMRMHGDDAALVVADLAGARFADGDLDGFTLWTRIGAAITDWSRQAPGCTDCVN